VKSAYLELHPGPVSPLVTKEYFRQTASMVKLLKRQSKQQLLIFVRKLPSLPMERHCEQIDTSCTEHFIAGVDPKKITVAHIVSK